MMTGDCPNRDTLFAFQTGRLSDDEANTLIDHLSDCVDCQVALKEIAQSQDTFLACLRQPVGDSPYAAEPRRKAFLKEADGIRDKIASPGLSTEPANRRRPLTVKRIGEYEILRRLGEGGMGAVYLARQINLKKIVALKMISQSRREDREADARFNREMAAVGGLDHPNIVRAFDAREIDGQPILVTEYVDGPNLEQLVKHSGPLPIADACELIRQAAMGLQYAHEHGLVHRDIKPSNLMLARGQQAPLELNDHRANLDLANVDFSLSKPTVKILDFGLALLRVTADSGNRELTDTGQIMGTLDYMAPEQTSDSHEIDIRADIYSLGATLYRLLAGHAPFGHPRYNPPVKKIMAVANVLPPPIRESSAEIPEALAEIVHRMLSKAPEGRYQSPAEVAIALAPFTKQNDLSRLLGRFTDGKPLKQRERDRHSASTLPSITHDTNAFKDANAAGTTRPISPPDPDNDIACTGGNLPATDPLTAPADVKFAWNRFRMAAASCVVLLAILAIVFGMRIRGGAVEHPELAESSDVADSPPDASSSKQLMSPPKRSLQQPTSASGQTPRLGKATTGAISPASSARPQAGGSISTGLSGSFRLSDYEVSETRVNDYTNARQYAPSTAVLTNGNYVVGYVSWGPDYGSDCYGRLYAADGTILIRQFRLNGALTQGWEYGPGLAPLPNGGLVAAFGHESASTHFQCFDSEMKPGIAGHCGPYDTWPTVASDAHGGFIVAGGCSQRSLLFIQRYSSAGKALGTPLQSTKVANGVRISATPGPNDFLTVVWTVDDGTLVGQHLGPNGEAFKPVFRIDSGPASNPSIGRNSKGELIVVWHGRGQNDVDGIFARRLSPFGASLSSSWQVNETTDGTQKDANLTVASSGEILIAWTGPDQSGQGVFARLFDPTGRPISSEFQVNQYTSRNQAMSGYCGQKGTAIIGSSMLFVWSGEGPDDKESVYLTRFDRVQ